MRYLLTLSYLGTAYHGWQVQTNARAIQPVVQDAMAELFPERPGLTGCSRTDAGVHAERYYCHFDSDRVVDPYGVICSLNRRLPNDIAVVDCRPVANDFHARYSVTAKEYEYRIYNGRHRDPFTLGRALHYRFPLRVEAMGAAAACFVGRQDFSSFCAGRAKPGDKTRSVFAAEVYRQGDLVIFRVKADGFLYHMVRIMAGTLLRVSEGKLAPGDLPAVLAARDRRAAGPTAPPEGLYLTRVWYENE